MAIQAPILWAQRQDKIYLTINLKDIKNEEIKISSTEFSFKGSSLDKNYESVIQFYKNIDKENSKYQILGFQARFIFEKENKEDDFWPRITLENKKYNNISIDWDRYVDQDEQEDDNNQFNWDPSQMQMPNMGDMGQQDSDDEGDQEDNQEGEQEDVQQEDNKQDQKE